MINKCHKGHWVIIERVVSTVPLGVQGLCPTPISAVFKWPKGPLLADSTPGTYAPSYSETVRESLGG